MTGRGNITISINTLGAAARIDEDFSGRLLRFNNMRGRILIPITLLFLVFTSGCITQWVEVKERERDRVLEYADPIADNILEALNQNSYANYSMNFTRYMKMALNAAQFIEHRKYIVSRVGLYLSRGEGRVMKRSKNVMVIYEAAFENESVVTVKIMFVEYDRVHQVDGLLYDSPKLRD